MKVRQWELFPQIQIGEIVFGCEKGEIQKILGRKRKSFCKSIFSKNLTDDYSNYHIYYDDKNLVEAVEIFRNIEVVLNGKILFPGTVKQAQKILTDLQYEDGSYISHKESIGLYAPNDDGNIEAILVAEKGYYG